MEFVLLPLALVPSMAMTIGYFVFKKSFASASLFLSIEDGDEDD